MICIQKHVAIGKRAGIFGLEPAIGRKSSNDAKFTSQFSAGVGRKISVQLNRFDARPFRGVANFVSTCVNKNTDRTSAARYPLDDLAGDFWFDITRALRIKV